VKLKYPGVPVYLDGQNYYIPSLSTRDFRAHYETLTAAPAADGGAIEAFDRYIPIVLLAVNRNYPEVTQGQLEEWLDLYTFRQAIAAVQNASGMTPVTEGE
jgi:hypothetical protein